MPNIPITGVPSNFRAPLTAVEIVFNQGASSAVAGARDVILVMPMLASGANWTTNTVYGPIRNEQEVIDGAGAGAVIHRAARRFLKVNQRAKLWCLPYLPSSGAGVGVATGTVTWTTVPTATGTTRVWVCGELCEYSFTTSDTVTTIAAGIKASINAKTWLPVTSDNASGVLTITAKTAGKSQGDGTSGAITMRADIDLGKGTTVATSGAAVGLGAGTDGADGATTEAANMLTALNVIAGVRYYHIVCSVWHATEVGQLKTHIATKSDPIPGHRCTGIVGYTGILASGQTLATGRNYERLQIVWSRLNDDEPWTLAAQVAGVRQKREEVDTAFNFDFYNQADWLTPPQDDESTWPTLDDLDDAITDGLTPIVSTPSGSYLCFSATTRTKAAGGSVDDFRSLETHRVSVCDEFADNLIVRHKLNNGAKKLKADQLLPSGEINHNQRLGPNVITPSLWAGLPRKLADEFDAAGKIDDVETTKRSLRVGKDPANGGRLEAGMDLRVIDLLHQLTLRIAETSPG